METKDLKHPMQPIGWDSSKIIRFKVNKIVELLLDTSKLDLNDIAMMNARGIFNKDDYDQLMQLIGYSVCGYSDLSSSPEETVKEANRIADELVAEKKKKEE
jgi:divalent metal cation (Fe/Co/Zn/Cd) transporter